MEGPILTTTGEQDPARILIPLPARSLTGIVTDTFMKTIDHQPVIPCLACATSVNASPAAARRSCLRAGSPARRRGNLPAAGAKRLWQVHAAEPHRRPHRPGRGEIWLGQTRLDTQPADERARLRGRHFGIVYQDFNLLPTPTVEENLRLPLEINHLPRDDARLDACSSALA